MGRLYKGRLLWNAFPGSLLFVACRAGMKRSRKAGMFFVKNLPPSRLQGCFPKKLPIQRVCKGVFRKSCPFRGSVRVAFKISRPFGGSVRVVFEINRPFGGSVRVIWERNHASNTLFFGGFSPKTAFPCAWKCCFRRGRRGMSLVWMGESGKAHRGLSFLRCFLECFAFQLLGHVTRLHVHIVDVLFAIVAARGTFAAQHQRVVA